ncbi:MAG: hypothetical protein ABI622_08150 [Chloroflexota bacterium]
MTIIRRSAGAATLALLTLLAACSAAQTPSATPSGSGNGSSPPGGAESPSAVASPSVQATPDPVARIRLELPALVTPATDLDVLELPAAGAAITSLTPADGATALMGPLILDGENWYLLAGIGTQWTGWAPAEALEVTGSPDETTTIITLDGRGSGDADSANVAANTALVARVMATPMDGRETCEIEVTVAGVDGAHVTVNDVTELDATSEFIASGLDDESLRQADAGQVSMQVRSDCTFAASLDALPL